MSSESKNELTETLLADLRKNYMASLPGHIDYIENQILALEDDPTSTDTFQELYRKVHSLKGSGGVYGFHIITSVCHQFEDYLSQFDPNSMQSGKTAVDALLAYVDLLRQTENLIQTNQTDFDQIEKSLGDLKGSQTGQMASGLIVDPSATNLKIYQQILEKAGYQVSIARSCIEALDRLLTERFDFFISSLELRRMPASALLAAVRESRGINRDTKSIFVSSSPKHEVDTHYQPDALVTKDTKLVENLPATVASLLK
jgi:chemotaxis protein histidine kinase CheA